MSKWIKCVSDPRHKNGLFYFCAEGHSWFKTFDELREMLSGENTCDECAKVQPTPDV